MIYSNQFEIGQMAGHEADTGTSHIWLQSDIVLLSAVMTLKNSEAHQYQFNP